MDSADSLSSRELHDELLSRPVEFWEPGHFWDWKGENFQKVARFVILAVRSLDGTESDDLAVALTGNIDLAIPWISEDSAELSMLLMEEFIEKKVAHLRALLKEIDEAFREHPDFSDRKEAIFADFERFRAAVDGLKFNSLSENWIDAVPGIEL